MPQAPVAPPMPVAPSPIPPLPPGVAPPQPVAYQQPAPQQPAYIPPAPQQGVPVYNPADEEPYLNDAVIDGSAWKSVGRRRPWF
jgi:hypothetical protein